MSIPTGATEVASKFARAVVRRKWADIVPMLTTNAQSTFTAERLAAEFDWANLGPRLRREFIKASGESEDMVPKLDRPKRFEVFEVEERALPEGHDPAIPVGWVEVDFQPSEDSEFDVCYNCFLAFVDEDGPRITSFSIESAME